MAKASSLVCVEALESRELLSDTISFADWTQMVSPGAWWEYQTEYSAGGVSGSCTEKIQVANALANIGGTKCALVSSGYGKSKTRTAYFASDQGTFEKQVVLSSGGIGLKFTLDNLQIAPATMNDGDDFTGACSFKGSFSTRVKGYDVAGSISGTASSDTSFGGYEDVETPAGTFNAAYISTTTTLSGSLVLHAAGQSARFDYTATMETDLWTVQDVGPVQCATDVTTTISPAADSSSLPAGRMLPAAWRTYSAETSSSSELTAAGYRKVTTLGAKTNIQPGDMILYRGASKAYVSTLLAAQVAAGDRSQLGPKAVYQYAAIYLGNGQVAQMLPGGCTIQSLAQSLQSGGDVFRLNGIGDQGQAVANAAAAYAGVPYAPGEMGILGALPTHQVNLATDLSNPWLPADSVAQYEESEVGDSAMTSAELAYRCFTDQGLSVTVKPWRNMLSYSSWGSDLQADFVTPDMLFLGGSFAKIATF